MHIALIEPYCTGSHAAWAHGYAAHSAHQVTLLTLEGRFWKWRMHGGAVTLARRFRELPKLPDVILATDMLDLTTFLSLTRERSYSTPVALYMHENQLSYPTRPGEKRDLHYGFINYASMLCADAILFNSRYHLESWFAELPRLLKHFPDHNELGSLAPLRQRSSVLPLGLSLQALLPTEPASDHQGPALIVWNHRWEYDKRPAAFFGALSALAAQGLRFEVAILGERFVRVPPVFQRARERLGSRVVRFGYAESRAEYARWLRQGDIIVSTALHDFFGAAVVEAVAAGCWPILPRRLSYPELIPAALHDACLYEEGALVQRLAYAVEQIETLRRHPDRQVLREAMRAYDWERMAPPYDAALESLL
jgi:glycosyltransferase involved in cell wall biosynthesis